MFFYKVLDSADWAMPWLFLLALAVNIAILVETTLFSHRDPQVQAIAEVCNVSYSEAASFVSDGWFLFQKQYPSATQSQFLDQMLEIAQAVQDAGASCQEAFPPLESLG